MPEEKTPIIKPIIEWARPHLNKELVEAIDELVSRPCPTNDVPIIMEEGK